MLALAGLALAPLAANLLLALVAVGLGRRILGGAPGDDPLRPALALPLGVGVVAQFLFVLLALHGLTPAALALAALAGAALAAPGLRRAVGEARALLRAWEPGDRRRVLSLAAASALALLALGLYPPSTWDAVIYHLPFARLFDESGGFAIAERLLVPVFPALGESLFAALRMAAGDLAAQQLQAVAVLATAGLAAAWARERVPELAGAGAIAAAAVGAAPIAVFYAGTAYVDPLLAMFATGSLVALDRLRREPTWRWAAVAGALAGWAAGVKYQGLFFAVAVPLAGAAFAPRGARRRLFAAAALAALLAAAPWYGRIVAATGNPVFPFAGSIFGENEWRQLGGPPALVGEGAHQTLPDGLAGVPARLAALWRLPWDLVAARQRYNWQPPFSPAVLVFVPLLALALWRRPWSRALAGLGGLFVLALTPLPPDARYLTPIAPLGAVLGLGGLSVALADRTGALADRARWLRRARSLAFLLWLPLPLYLAFHYVRQGPPPAGAAARAAYLARTLPGYRALAELDRRAGTTSRPYLLHLERLIYHAAGEAAGEHVGPYRYRRVDGRLCDPRELAAELRRLDRTHLVAPRAWAIAIPRGAAFEREFRLLYEDDEAVVLELRGAARGSGAGDGRPRGRGDPRGRRRPSTPAAGARGRRPPGLRRSALPCAPCAG